MKIYRYKDKCNVSGVVIRRLREKHGLTQEQLAARLQCLGIDLIQKSISRIETGERVVADYELAAFANVFSVPIEIFVEDCFK